jgi:NADPH-dependent curcumin reductase CurA
MNRRILLARYPDGRPGPDDFIVDAEAPAPAPAQGEVLIAVTHLSMDPFPRLRMCERPVAGPPIRPGDLIDSRGLGRVIESRHPDYRPGDMVAGDMGWQTLVSLPGDRLKQIDLSLGPPERHLSVLGPSGMTAYFSMEVVGGPKAGDTVLVAPAAGSVGAIAGQIARHAGARVIGTARGEGQQAALLGLGFDQVLDGDAPQIEEGIDLFLDGVGGALHDTVLARLNPRARVVLLGFISAYGDAAPPRYGNAAPVLFRRARMEGFLLADWETRFDEAQRQLSAWLRDGVIRPVEAIWDGLEQAPHAFAALFADAPPGKQIVRLET